MDHPIRFCCSRDGTRIAWSECGRGPALVRISTWPTHLEYDRHSPVVGPWIDDLSSDHRLVRFDMRGTGLSDRDVADVRPLRWVEDLEAVVDAAGLDRFALMGHSNGAAIAAMYAVKHPQRVGALVLCGAYSRGRERRARDGAEAERVIAFRQLVRIGWDTGERAFRHVFSMLFMPDAMDAHRDAWDRLQPLACTTPMALRLIAEFEALDIGAEARQLRVPTLIAHARDDRRVPLEEARQLAALIPGATLMVLETANHFWLDHDAEWGRFHRQWREFVDSPPAATGTARTAHEIAALTPRERQVLEGIAGGQSNGEIGADLGISEATLRNHISRIFAKLGVQRRSQAIVKARDAGYGVGRH